MGFEGQIAQRDWNDAKNQSIPAGQKIQPPEVLFQKIEDELIELEIKKLHELSKKTVTAQAQEKTPLAPLKEMIEIEDFQKLDLRVGVIRKAARVKKSKKLLELQVDIGLEERTIAAGIGEYEEPDQLIGRKVVVVANLKPATLMGVTSQGMLLAGKEPGSIQFVAVDMEPGTVVC
jgi:methionyl-tRNA synthetase